MASYLITGTSQGIGLELVRDMAKRPTSEVSTIFATTRSASPPEGLYEIIKASSGKVHHVQLDVISDDSVNAAAKTVESHLGSKGLDCLINNAGVGTQCYSLNTFDVTAQNLRDCFDTNVVAVHRVTVAFLPLLRKGSKKQILNMSSTQGSIGQAMIPYWAGNGCRDYKVSKAALNMLTVQWAVTLGEEGFTVQSISPGHLTTKLGTGSGMIDADLPADVGARSVVETIVNGSEKADNGRFRDIDVKGWHHRYAGKDPSF